MKGRAHEFARARGPWMAWALVVLWAVCSSGCSSPEGPATGDQCEDIADCARTDNDLVCKAKQCAKVECVRPEDCPYDATCLKAVCAPPECAEHADCGEEATCYKGICIEGGCVDKRECAPNQVCLGAPAFCREPPDHCTSDEECPVESGCLLAQGRCLPSCAVSAQCDGELYCLDGLCRSPCQSSDECTGGRSCFRGRCEQLPDCSDQPACTGLFPYRHPRTCECVACLDDTDCDVLNQEVCTAQNECTYCAQQASSIEDCAIQSLEFDKGCCVECTEDAQCSTAQGVECITSSDCADGEVCDRSRCVPGASFQACQTQSDCPTGEACYGDGLCRNEAQTCGGCPGVSRCVAEDGDQVGTCAGCTTHCGTDNCPDDQVCVLDDGATEGYCLEASAVPSCR